MGSGPGPCARVPSHPLYRRHPERHPGLTAASWVPLDVRRRNVTLAPMNVTLSDPRTAPDVTLPGIRPTTRGRHACGRSPRRAGAVPQLGVRRQGSLRCAGRGVIGLPSPRCLRHHHQSPLLAWPGAALDPRTPGLRVWRPGGRAGRAFTGPSRALTAVSGPHQNPPTGSRSSRWCG
jgi:hypothetical protein